MANAPRVTEANLKDYGFVSGAGTGWYYPAKTYPHIHLSVVPDPNDRTKRVVDFVSFSLSSHGQNLKACKPNKFGDFKYNEDTPGIDWGTDKRTYLIKLRGINIVKKC